MNFKTATIVTAVAALLAPVSAASAEERLLNLDPAATSVHFTVTATGHDVEGTFHVTSGAVQFDTASGNASGEIRVDALSAATGNGSRDKTLRGDVLEVERYPLFVFTPEHVVGALPASGEGQVELRGVVSLHGASHPLSLPAKVHLEGDRLKLSAEFPVPYVEWGLHNPSVLFLKVADVVQVRIEGEGTLSAASPAAAAPAAVSSHGR
jgi:polyisoprenoid-binding protein YceI